MGAAAAVLKPYGRAVGAAADLMRTRPLLAVLDRGVAGAYTQPDATVGAAAELL